MTITIAFDVYGTLVNPHGIAEGLKPLMGNDDAMLFSHTWRNKQLEYSFRRGLMRAYEEFPVCIRQALDYACAFHGKELAAEEKSRLMSMYLNLPAYADAEAGLLVLQDLGVRCFAFSNGVEREVRALLANANLENYFEGIVSVDEVQSFKPDPEVYLHFLNKTRSSAEHTWLVSSNPFDVLGALSVGWQGAWVKRTDNAIFDPWEIEPTMVVDGIPDLLRIVENPG